MRLIEAGAITLHNKTKFIAFIVKRVAGIFD
jgi:hypothetical protein